MKSNKEEINVKHLFCIAYGIYNPDYENDASFTSSYEYIKNLSGGSRFGSNLNAALIFGLYPELKEPCEEFRKRSRIIAISGVDNRSISEKLDEASDIIIKKYNLPHFMKMSSPKEIKTNANVQKSLKYAILKNIREDYSPVVAELATRYADKANDFMELEKSFIEFSRASWILTGKIDEKYAFAHKKLDGAFLGLGLLQLKKDGIITEKEILDMQKFNRSEVVKHVKFDGKVFDLSPQLPQKTNQNDL